MASKKHDIEIQRCYYAETAEKYNEMHVNEKDEHFVALSFMLAVIDYLEIHSILDIGSGTGRAVAYIKEKRPDIFIVGVEPVRELRKIGYSQGLSKNELIDGDATQLKFDNGQFDLVCEFGVLHHIKNPEKAVSEMLRVAKKAIFISDSNNFGQGSRFSRAVKQLINGIGLWSIADFIKTKGKGYTISEGDGLAYSYSVFNNYNQIKKQCKRIHLLNTKDGAWNFYRTVSHVALLGIKNDY
jgi:ubiquinone/menaquinone biosynthesis C-methylase UbiE